MELLFLGTGSGVPSKQRNVSSLALKLLDEINSIWLFDCGEATQHQILKTTLKPRKINKIFITHMHGDHIFGLPGFLSSRSFQGGKDQLTIYGPKGIKAYVLSSLKYSRSHVKYPLKFVEFEKTGLLFEEKSFKVYVEKLKHGVPSYGFRIEEADHEGSLDAKKLKELDIPSGPVYGQIKNKEIVELEDGRIIDGADFVGPKHKGRVVTILGDTVKHPNSVLLAKNANVLVHESTFGLGDELMAQQYNHSTASQAAQIASEAKVEKLLLNHMSSRYLYKDVRKIVKEARKEFPNTYVMSDLDEVKIPLNKEEINHD
ncbi:MAG: ribonuclease Z [Atopostipes suicloacalis]|nr:ribonuclease Z [Atopostipes suicloacalis]MDN6730955.1 ribonuclease Z [Atopostipes suicloacalis]